MWSARGWVKDGASEKSRSINPLGLAVISEFRREYEVIGIKGASEDWPQPLSFGKLNLVNTWKLSGTRESLAEWS